MEGYGPETYGDRIAGVYDAFHEEIGLDTEGAVIPGLHAAGELVGGLFYFNYPGGTGLMNGAVFGRIAGSSAGQRAKQIP